MKRLSKHSPASAKPCVPPCRCMLAPVSPWHAGPGASAPAVPSHSPRQVQPAGHIGLQEGNRSRRHGNRQGIPSSKLHSPLTPLHSHASPGSLCSLRKAQGWPKGPRRLQHRPSWGCKQGSGVHCASVHQLPRPVRDAPPGWEPETPGAPSQMAEATGNTARQAGRLGSVVGVPPSALD